MHKNDKPVFVLQSGTNIDRLVSVYRAAKRSDRILYEDNCTALIAYAADGKIPRPDVFGDVYAFTPRALSGMRKELFFKFENRRGWRQIKKNTNFVMLVRQSMRGYMEKLHKEIGLQGATLVYSMWSGYKDNEDMKTFLDRLKDLGVEIVDLHTSGHASEEDIELLKQTVCADEYVFVHTCPASVE